MTQTLSPQSLAVFQPPIWARTLEEQFGSSGRVAINTVTIPSADLLDDSEFHAQIHQAYQNILTRIKDLNHHPIRFWHYIPRLTSPASQQRNRYMIFNAARYEALSHFHGSPSHFDNQIAAATAVGGPQSDLIIHCLSIDTAATPLNNPRQVAPYHYSQRFGPLPPCFARAVRIRWPEDLLIVGGTAAIRGEDSVYREDLGRQIHETFANLSALICAAHGECYASDKHDLHHLPSYRDLRVYFPNPEHEAAIRAAIKNAFPNISKLELIIADLCRPELLIEIEGIAELAT